MIFYKILYCLQNLCTAQLYSPVIDGPGMINFTINICPSGSMVFENKKEIIDDLLDGIDIKDIIFLLIVQLGIGLIST